MVNLHLVAAIISASLLAGDQQPSASSDAELKAQVQQLLESQKQLMQRLSAVEEELAESRKSAGQPRSAFGMPRTESISMVPGPEPVAMQQEGAVPEEERHGKRAKNGWYLSLSGGGQDRIRSREDNFTFIDWEDHGWQIHGAFGNRITENVRLEVESGAMNNDVSVLSAPGPGGIQLIDQGSGDATVVSLMMNLYLDLPIDITDNFTIVPYVGGGFGGIKSYLDHATNEIVEPLGFVCTANSHVALATQLTAGISVPLTKHMELFAGYRYVNSDKLFFFVQDVPAPPAYVGPTDSEWNGGEFGIRWTF